jgi:hypothetical protein
MTSKSLINGAPEEIRTPDPQIRSLVLYPAELRARFSLAFQGAGPADAACDRDTFRKVAKARHSYRLRPGLARSGNARLGTNSERLAVIPGRCEASNPESRSIRSNCTRFRVRSLCERPGMTEVGRLNREGSAALYARARSLRMLSNSTGRSGITIRKVAPMVPSTRWISPPWARTSSAAIASPSPLPPGRPEVWNASNR